MTKVEVKQAPVKSAAKKIERDAERAKRFPTEAKKAEEKAVAKETPKAVPKAKEQVAFIKRVLPKGAAFYAIAEGARPTKNPLLFAHTQAALAVLNMFAPERPSVPKAALLTLIGQRAVKHHTEKGNFESGPDHGIRLSISGRNEFAARKVDNKVANAYVDLFITGKTSAPCSVRQGEVYQAKIA